MKPYIRLFLSLGLKNILYVKKMKGVDIKFKRIIINID